MYGSLLTLDVFETNNVAIWQVHCVTQGLCELMRLHIFVHEDALDFVS